MFHRIKTERTILISSNLAGSKIKKQMHKKLQQISVLALMAMFIFVSCDSDLGINPVEEFEYDEQPQLSLIDGGESVTINVGEGSNNLYELTLTGTGGNKHLSTGTKAGWSLLWESPLSYDTTYEDVMLYSTNNEEYWKPVNFLLNEREALKENNKLTLREIQAAIWTLIEFSGFDIENTGSNGLPGGNGEAAFSEDRVLQAVDMAKSNASSFQYTPESTYALIGYSETEGQFVVIEETPYAFEIVDLREGYNMVVAWDINDSGQIAGGNLFWDNETGLTTMGNIFARSMNNRGEVVGSRGQEAAYWSQGSGVLSLSSLSGDASVANAINEQGQVAGEITYETLLFEDEEFGDEYEYEYKAFVWENGEDSNIIGSDGWATGINNSGLVVGTDYTISNRGFIWDESNGIRSLGSFSGFSSSRPNAINNHGEVVGSVLVSQSGSGSMMASSHIADTINEIERLFKRANVSGTYDYAHVMEMVQNSTFQRDAFPWKDEVNSKLSAELPVMDQALRGKLSMSQASFQSEAFIWHESKGMMNLGTLGGSWSTAWDMNDHGQVVGYSDIGNGENRAFYWDENRGMIELPTLGGNSMARAINNEGDIVGYSYDESGNFYPVKWKVSIRQTS